MSSTHRADLFPGSLRRHACRECETVPDGPCADHGTDLERARQLRVAAGR